MPHSDYGPGEWAHIEARNASDRAAHTARQTDSILERLEHLERWAFKFGYRLPRPSDQK